MHVVILAEGQKCVQKVQETAAVDICSTVKVTGGPVTGVPEGSRGSRDSI